MDDMPSDVATLQDRLRKARDEFAKLRERDGVREREFHAIVAQRIEWERRAIVAETAVMHGLAVLNGDPEPRPLKSGDAYYPPPDHPLFVAAIDAVSAGAAAVRMRGLLAVLLSLVDNGNTNEIDVDHDWNGLLLDIRTELGQP